MATMRVAIVSTEPSLRVGTLSLSKHGPECHLSPLESVPSGAQAGMCTG